MHPLCCPGGIPYAAVAMTNYRRNPAATNHRLRQAIDPTFRTWRAMLQRCHDPKHHNYRYYGGRDIRVCERWLVFQNFVDDMGERPQGTTLDRISSTGDYHPNNCRWADIVTQNRNHGGNRLLTYQGRTQCLSAWADEVGMQRITLSKRMEAGWAVERALTEPVAPRKRAAHAQ